VEIIPLGPGLRRRARGVTLADIAADDAAYKGHARRLIYSSLLRGQGRDDEAAARLLGRFGPLE